MFSDLKDRKFWLLYGLGALFSFFIPFFGSPFLRILRNVHGRRLYWLSGLATVGLLVSLKAFGAAVFLIALWLVIGAFAEFEERGLANFWTGNFVIWLGALVAWQGPVLLEQVGISPPNQSLQENLEAFVRQLEKEPSQKAWIEAFGLTTEALLAQLPSMLALLFLICFAFSLIFDRRIALLAGFRFEQIAGTPRLIDFRVPDWLVWLFMLSFLFSFLQLGSWTLSVVALNTLQYLLGIYLFQGLAVLETALLIFRVGPFFRALLYIFIVGQLFFLLSLVGLADFWVDFRRRLRHWRAKKQMSE